MLAKLETQMTIIVVEETKEENLTAVEVEVEINIKEKIIVAVAVVVVVEEEEGEEEVAILTNAKILSLEQVNINMRNGVHFHVNSKVEYRT